MTIAQLTPEEIVQILCRSQLPTVLVEGRDDMSVYRWLESCGAIGNVDVMQCGGRTALMTVYQRRNEFSHIPCAFLADRDLWLFSRVPEEYREIVLTRGYSIENDLLDGSCVHSLLDPPERTEFNSLANCLAEWFAFEVEQFRRLEDYQLDLHPNYLIPIGSHSLNYASLAPRTFHRPRRPLVNSILNNFTVKFRGKTLVQLYLRILSAPDRCAKYSRSSILEISAKCDSTSHTARLVRLIGRRLSVQNAGSGVQACKV